MSNIVNVEKYRQEYDHLFRLANVDYHACVGVREIESWKEIATRALAQVEGLQCKRAKPHDREQFDAATAAVKARLVAADDRIAQLRKTLTPAQRAAAERLRNERPPVADGTNTIVDTRERIAFYNKVADEMKALNVGPALVGEFCNIAGVPD